MVMIDVAAADLEIDDGASLTAAQNADLKNGYAHIGKCHRDISQHADTIIHVDLQKSLVYALCILTRLRDLPIGLLPAIGSLGILLSLNNVRTILLVNGQWQSRLRRARLSVPDVVSARILSAARFISSPPLTTLS